MLTRSVRSIILLMCASFSNSQEVLSELYWMNVNDPEFPFVGVIEHTNLDQADPAGRRHIVYFSRYLPGKRSGVRCA